MKKIPPTPAREALFEGWMKLSSSLRASTLAPPEVEVDYEELCRGRTLEVKDSPEGYKGPGGRASTPALGELDDEKPAIGPVPPTRVFEIGAPKEAGK